MFAKADNEKMCSKEDPVIQHILVAVDGSPFSFRAARLGAKILHRNVSGTLTLLYITKLQGGLEWFKGPGSDLGKASEEERRALEEAFKKGQEVLKEAQVACSALLKEGAVRIETVVVPGEPAQKIIETAEKNQCDMIIIGSRGAGTIKGALLGSVSQKVLNNTQCPVLIVK
jgi:nucleotide-binding universal stress UspA family protein